MEWSEEENLALIEAYKLHPSLWNPADEYYYKSNKKFEAWRKVSSVIGRSEYVCRKKMESLLSSYRRQKSREKKSRKPGSSPSESRWYAYKAFQFLENRDKTGPGMDTGSVDESQEEIDAGNSSQYVEEDQNSIRSKSPPRKIIKIAESANLGKTYKVYASVPSSASSADNASVDESQEEIDAGNSSQYVEDQNSIRSKSPPRKNIKITESTKLGKTYKVYASVPSSAANVCRSFGAYVVHKLQNYTPETRSAVENAISNILFQADRGNFEQNYVPQIFSHYLSDAHQEKGAEMTVSGERGYNTISDPLEELPEASSTETQRENPNVSTDLDLDDKSNVLFNVQ